jgi:hypothetical protein
VILVIVLRIGSSNGIRIVDFIPMIGVLIFFTFQNYSVIKKERNILKERISSINNNQVFEYDNILISKSDNDKNIIKVRNTLFWLDLKQNKAVNYDNLMDNLISDFKKLIKKNKSFDKILVDRIIEFSIIDNINYDDKVLIQKEIEYNELQKTNVA